MQTSRSPWLIKDREIRFAVVGCGRISANHLDAIKSQGEQARIVAVCDIDPMALEAAGAQTGAKMYRNLKQLLAESDADIVSICTPSGLHPIHGIAAARAGRHVLTEKPMATQLEAGRELVRTCDEEQVRLFVVMQNRRNATLQLLKRAIQENRFGRIYMVNVNVFWTRPQSYYDQAPWRGKWEFDGGAFMNQASHYVDLLTWLIGPIESLQAYSATLARKIEAEDTGVISIRWRSGALGSMNVTMLTYPKNLEGSITILGEKGTVRVGGIAVNEIQHWEFDEMRPEDTQVKQASYNTASVYGRGHPLYYQNVIQTLRGEAEPETDGRQGLDSLQVLAATYLSARDGRRVSLPLY